MEWEDDAYVLSARAFGESGAIVELLTEGHGRHAAHVAGGASRRMKPVLQPGAQVVARFRALPADTMDGEVIQNEVYEAGKEAGFEPLRAWFQALYEVLLGQTQGPRFGSFAAIYGLDRTIALIERALAGDDLSAG